MMRALLAGTSAIALGFAGTAMAQDADLDIFNDIEVYADVDSGYADADVTLDDDGTVGVGVVHQDATNYVEASDDLIDDSYDASQTFDGSFVGAAGISGQFNSGINAGQQGTVAAGVDTDDNALGLNVGLQDIDNDVALSDGYVVGSEYNTDLTFSNGAFSDFALGTGAFNSGINAGQQGAVAAAAAVSGDTVVAANVLAQVVTNDITGASSLIDSGPYSATMTFNSGAFDNSALAAVSFNSGLNAAQQGAVAVAGSTSTLP